MYNEKQEIEDLKKVLNNNGQILFAYLFGSKARGQATPLSDIDIAVYLSPPIDGDTRLAILGTLIDAAKSDNIDLVILNTAPLPIKIRVLKSNVLLVDKAPFYRQAFESFTMRMYIDFSRLEKRILKERFLDG